MADIKISQLPAAAKLAPADLLMTIQSGNNKKITFENMFNNITVNTVINSDNAAVSLRVKGSVGNNSLLFTNPVTNKIGIGTDSPTELLHVSGGNFKVGGDGVSGVIINSTDEVVVDGTTSKAANVTTQITKVTFSGSSTALNLTLGSGVPNQIKTVIIHGAPTGGVCTVSVIPALYNGTTPNIQLRAKGDVVTMLYTADGWMILNYYGASIT